MTERKYIEIDWKNDVVYDKLWVEKDGWPVEFINGHLRFPRIIFAVLRGARYRRPTVVELKRWGWWF